MLPLCSSWPLSNGQEPLVTIHDPCNAWTRENASGCMANVLLMCKKKANWIIDTQIVINIKIFKKKNSTSTFVKKEWRYFLQSVHKAYRRAFGSCKVLPNAWMDTKVFSTTTHDLCHNYLLVQYNYLGVESCGCILCRLIDPHQKMIVNGQRDLSFSCVWFLKKLMFVFILMFI